MFIDKTKALDKGIAAFPSLFIEGAAACGKTTVVNMFLKAHPEVNSDVFFMDKEARDFTTFQLRLQKLTIHPDSQHYIIFENIDRNLTSEFQKEIAEFIETMPPNAKAFLISREKPAYELLDLLWKGKMGMIFADSLRLTEREVYSMINKRDIPLNTEEVYRQTGGWPGCVNMILHISEQLGPENTESKDVKKLIQRYEIQSYIQHEILDTLSEDEKEILDWANSCPWLNEQLVAEIWGRKDCGETIKDLERKGMLLYNSHKRHWRIAPLFHTERENEYSLCLAKYYEKQNAMEEALWCYLEVNQEQELKDFVIRHFDKIPFYSLQKIDVKKWEDDIPELCYLRGMYDYRTQDFEGLRKEAACVQKQEGRLAEEVYLNLTFADPKVTLKDWLTELEQNGRKCAPVRLYQFTENTPLFTTGLRELSGLFLGSEKEVHSRMAMLREVLGEKEWMAIQFAHIDFMLETLQKGILTKQESEPLLRIAEGKVEDTSWQFELAALFLLKKIHTSYDMPEILDAIRRLEERLKYEENEYCQKILYAMERIFAFWDSQEDYTARWLQKAVADRNTEVTEENYLVLCMQAKGYMMLKQYGFAENILRRLIPYLQAYRRTRMLAELLFQRAIINWVNDKRGAALRDIIESFLYTGENRYVTFYVDYGISGKEVLEAYVEWLRSSDPEKWVKKKKYKYGNVLRMNREDYLGLLLRLAKRKSKTPSGAEEEKVDEQLTMMETIILQDINKGLKNAEICTELNLKLPTVKTHISNVYKKLGVNNRVQAILKGKEMGILK